MYFGQLSIYHLMSFFVGYECALREIGAKDESRDEFLQFICWLEHKYKIFGSAWGWARILHHAAGSEEAAFNLFFTDYAEFEIDLRKGINPKERVNFGAPESSPTNLHPEHR